MRKILFLIMAFLNVLFLNAAETFVSFNYIKGGFPIVNGGKPVNLVYDKTDYEGVHMAAINLQADICRVCGTKSELVLEPSGDCIIIGSLKSDLIRKLVNSGKIDVSELKGKREKYLLQVIDSPMSGVGRALVIMGSDKRGTIYGIYELSRQMGVSPWYWWMDVPTQHNDNVYIKPGIFTDGEPKVKYRGIFINDEWPSFGNWAVKTFGGINSKCYERIFELILRLKGNFMWPAMWGSAFYADDPQNGILADKMGVVMGTSHHEPMALAHADWTRNRQGAWNYETNGEVLRKFWENGIRRSNDWERVVTIGMRGDGDAPMGGEEGKDHTYKQNLEKNIRLLRKIIDDQRSIIQKVTGKKAEETPQVWALYKEVQDYYDKGMQVPDDVTLLLCDDNWGNVRRLPALDSKPRKGGYGMYYHFDYVGIPRNSKWININPIPRVWEQMNLCYSYGVNELWVVNVGDLKPMEYPITFFLDMAWNPESFNANNLIEHSVDFCRSIFGDKEAEEAARLLRMYAKFNRRMTPENLNYKTYSMHYDEWQRVTAEYNQLAADAEALSKRLSSDKQDSWFQLLGYPIYACSNLYDMYYAQAMNQRLAKKNNPDANLWADRVRQCYERDSLLVLQYHSIAGGKWQHMMDEIYIGYRSWNNPKHRIMPSVKYVDGIPTSKLVFPRLMSANVNSVSDKNEFIEKDGYISIEAEHFSRKIDGKEAVWTVIPELGRTLSAITPQPVTASTEGMTLEYDMEIKSKGYARVILRFSPTLNFNVKGLRYAVNFDGEQEQIVNINGHYKGELAEWQRDGVIECQTIHQIEKTGKYTLRVRPIDNGLVLQKIMVNMGGMHKSLLGPLETRK